VVLMVLVVLVVLVVVLLLLLLLLARTPAGTTALPIRRLCLCSCVPLLNSRYPLEIIVVPAQAYPPFRKRLWRLLPLLLLRNWRLPLLLPLLLLLLMLLLFLLLLITLLLC
jgi:hypothetical protein